MPLGFCLHSTSSVVLGTWQTSATVHFLHKVIFCPLVSKGSQTRAVSANGPTSWALHYNVCVDIAVRGSIFMKHGTHTCTQACTHTHTSCCKALCIIYTFPRSLKVSGLGCSWLLSSLWSSEEIPGWQVSQDLCLTCEAVTGLIHFRAILCLFVSELSIDQSFWRDSDYLRNATDIGWSWKGTVAVTLGYSFLPPTQGTVWMASGGTIRLFLSMGSGRASKSMRSDKWSSHVKPLPSPREFIHWAALVLFFCFLSYLSTYKGCALSWMWEPLRSTWSLTSRCFQS